MHIYIYMKKSIRIEMGMQFHGEEWHFDLSSKLCADFVIGMEKICVSVFIVFYCVVIETNYNFCSMT